MKAAITEVINLTWPTIVIVSCVLIIMRITLLIKSDRKNFILHEEIINLLFIIYLIILFQLVTSQDMPGGGSNFTPFKEIFRYSYGSRAFYKQVIGNIVLFIPFGYFISRYCKIKSLFPITIISLITSGVIECTQHFIGRCFDVDDIILNTVGGIVGFLLFIGLNAIKNHLPKMFRSKWFYNLLSLILIILLAFYLVKVII